MSIVHREAPYALQHRGECHVSDGQRKHREMADDSIYTWGSGLSRKMYLLRARRLKGRQAWMGPPSWCRAPH